MATRAPAPAPATSSASGQNQSDGIMTTSLSSSSTTTSNAARGFVDLQSICTNGLDCLKPQVVVRPRAQSQRGRMLSTLKKIERLEIRETVKRDGHRYFVINIFLQRRAELSRIPTVAAGRTTAPGEISPPRAARRRSSDEAQASPRSGDDDDRACDVQVEHRYSDFTNLRHEMLYHIRSGHESKALCEFGVAMAAYLTKSATLPRLRKTLLASAEELAAMLEQFVNDVLTITESIKTQSSNWCEGQEMIPVLLKQFLLGDGGEIDTSDGRQMRGGRERSQTKATSAWAF